ncbi:MAG: MurR/RpiR family transcriptional regulator [Clostridia bacterium]|nr:MurR/RpiR family transcriptional regulator [Clostridia bacterium]
MTNDLSARIEALMPSFSKGQRRIANAILNNYDKVAYMTAARLGVMVNVSESTVVRFANELGFGGYPELQRAIQELVRAKLTHNQRIEISNLRIGDGDVLEKTLLSDISKIRYTLDHIDRNAFESAVSALVKARNIYILGVRSSAALASFLNFNLSLIFSNVKFLQPSSSSEVFEQIIEIGEEDVLFAISFPRYSTKIVNAVKYARAENATVISLTDSAVSPIAEYATCLLTAQSDMASFVDSLVAPLSIINAIVVAVTKQCETEVIKRFDRLERIWDEYEVYAKK